MATAALRLFPDLHFTEKKAANAKLAACSRATLIVPPYHASMAERDTGVWNRVSRALPNSQVHLKRPRADADRHPAQQAQAARRRQGQSRLRVGSGLTAKVTELRLCTKPEDVNARKREAGPD